MSVSVSVPPGMVRAKLAQDGIQVSIEWVTACIEWLAEEQPGLSKEQVVQQVQEQWLSTDISEPGVVNRAVLPPDLADVRVQTLPGKYCLMIKYGVDIGSPAYGQLQKLHQVNNENLRVTEGEDESQVTQPGYQVTQGARKQASWQPKASRVLSLVLTDGMQTVTGLETQAIPHLPDWPKPGTKVRLIGPLIVRRGVILLGPDHVQILGGEVEDLVTQHTLKSVLEERVGTKDVGQTNRFADTSGIRQQQNQQQPQHQQQEQGHRQQQQHQNVNRQQQNQNQQRRSIPEDADSFPDDLDPFPDDPDAFPDDDVPFPEETDGSFPDDDDDDLLLEAASQIEDTMHTSQIETSVNSPSVAVVRPFKSNTNYTSQSPPSSCVEPSKVAPISTSTSTSISPDPEFELSLPMDEDPDYDAMYGPGKIVQTQFVAREPWTYLWLLQPLLDTGTAFTAKVKVVSATLASKVSLKKSVCGPVWQLSIMINDGSGSVAASLSSELLDVHLGSAARYVQPEADKNEYKVKSKMFSSMLAGLSAVLTLDNKQGDNRPWIVKIETLSGLHLAQMRRRKL